jgi:hypothetical protein
MLSGNSTSQRCAAVTKTHPLALASQECSGGAAALASLGRPGGAVALASEVCPGGAVRVVSKRPAAAMKRPASASSLVDKGVVKRPASASSAVDKGASSAVDKGPKRLDGPARGEDTFRWASTYLGRLSQKYTENTVSVSMGSHWVVDELFAGAGSATHCASMIQAAEQAQLPGTRHWQTHVPREPTSVCKTVARATIFFVM